MSPDRATSRAISLQDLAKRYGDVAALDGVTLEVPAGTIFGFLGPNGAGKTTALRILIGMQRASAGSATILGRDPWHDRVEVHRQVGYLPSGMGFHPHMTGRESLDHAAALHRGHAATSPLRAAALDALALSQRTLDRKVRDYSKGMRQKLAIAQAVQHDPELLLLDEPSEGLDPLVQNSFAAFLRERRDGGRTVFFSSHTLSEVQALCDHVAIIRLGKIVAAGTYEELLTHHPRVVTLTAPEGGEDALAGLGSEWQVVARDGADVVLHTTAAPEQVVHALAGMRFADVTITHASLEDVFLSYYEGGGER